MKPGLINFLSDALRNIPGQTADPAYQREDQVPGGPNLHKHLLLQFPLVRPEIEQWELVLRPHSPHHFSVL